MWQHLHFFKRKNYQLLSKCSRNINIFINPQQENCASEALFENGVRVFFAMYNAPESEHSINSFRYNNSSSQQTGGISSTYKCSSSTAYQSYLVPDPNLVREWFGSQDWEWVLQNETPEPTTTLLPSAPEALLNTNFCNCNKECSMCCGCSKAYITFEWFTISTVTFTGIYRWPGIYHTDSWRYMSWTVNCTKCWPRSNL